MLRLKATKTSLYRLVLEHEPSVGGFRHCEFRKAYRSPDYTLDWGGGGLWYHAFFSACCGKPTLSIEKKDAYGKQVSRTVYTLSVAELKERGMIEEVKK